MKIDFRIVVIDFLVGNSAATAARDNIDGLGTKAEEGTVEEVEGTGGIGKGCRRLVHGKRESVSPTPPCIAKVFCTQARDVRELLLSEVEHSGALAHQDGLTATAAHAALAIGASGNRVVEVVVVAEAGYVGAEDFSVWRDGYEAVSLGLLELSGELGGIGLMVADGGVAGATLTYRAVVNGDFNAAWG